MNHAYQEIIAAKEADRRDLFATAAYQAGTTIQNIEKDFWVCWTLDALFNHLPSHSPRLLFKGGTSLSKAYGLINRFSEDIDVTVFRDDIDCAYSCADLEKLSKKKRSTCLDKIRDACRSYIQGQLRDDLSNLATQTMGAAGHSPKDLAIEVDPQDSDGQSLLIRYPPVTPPDSYIAHSVKIESGAKSALDPNEKVTINPYVAPHVSVSGTLAIPNVTTIAPGRTFLDKVLILHGMTNYFAEKGALRGNGRMSRHYYDVHRLMSQHVGPNACADDALIEDCTRHAKMFFYRNNTGLDHAKRGSFQLLPTREMMAPLSSDYSAMSTMIFGDIPSLEEVLESVKRAETALNAAPIKRIAQS